MYCGLHWGPIWRNLASAFADPDFVPMNDAEIVKSKPDTFRFWAPGLWEGDYMG